MVIRRLCWLINAWKRHFSSPTSLAVSSVGLYILVEDVDALFAEALQIGAKIVKAVEDQFFGDYYGTLKDAFGHTWFLCMHNEDLTPEEINTRAEARFK